MTFRINVRSNVKQTLRQLAAEKAAVEKAAARAINRLAAQARTQASREIRKVYNVRATDVAKAIAITKRASPSSLQAVIDSEGRPVSLAHFGARQTRKGVTFRVLQAGGRESMKGAFIVAKSGGNVVFARGRYSGGRFIYDPLPGRLPIQKLFGPAVPSMFANQSVQRAMDKFIRENFEARFAHELRYLKSQGGA